MYMYTYIGLPVVKGLTSGTGWPIIIMKADLILRWNKTLFKLLG